MKLHSIIYCYLDLDLVMDLISFFLSSSNFLSSEDFVSCRFSSPSLPDLISEPPEETLLALQAWWHACRQKKKKKERAVDTPTKASEAQTHMPQAAGPGYPFQTAQLCDPSLSPHHLQWSFKMHLQKQVIPALALRLNSILQSFGVDGNFTVYKTST